MLNFLLIPSFVLFCAVIFILFIPKHCTNLLRNFALFIFLSIFIYFNFIFFFFTKNLNYTYFLIESYNWLDFINLNLIFGIDNISIFFLLLTSFLFPLCILISWESVSYNLKLFVILLFLLEIFLLNTFLSINLFFFFFFFESTMIPMFLIIGIWGSRQRKIHAVYQFFFYTFFGSIFLLLGILLLYSSSKTFDLRSLDSIYLTDSRQILLFFLFFLGLCIKIPIFPFHIWLPEAHVEAPTAGSVLLAGILLKIGSYGMVRFILPLFPLASLYFSSLIYLLCLISIVYTSMIAIRQVDLKKIIAYSSVAHMNFIVLGIFSFNLQGVGGSIFLMLSHGFVSSALFICIGVIYDRYGTRLIFYYSNLVQAMPLYSIFFFIFILANISFPGSSNFIGELLVLIGIFSFNFFTALVACFSIILSAIYSIWLINRILFGQFSNYIVGFSDLSKREFFILSFLLSFTIWLGIVPNYILLKLEFILLILLNYNI